MSMTGLEVFDRTLQITNIWLDEITDQMGVDRRAAWKILSSVLHTLRDRLPADLAAHLGAQLPLLVRGTYYDQYEPAKQPTGWHTSVAFADEVGKLLADTRPVDPEEAIDAVFCVLSRHVSQGQVAKIRRALPQSIGELWPEPEAPSFMAGETDY
jgi:uncharacterized protein (DUF2267 family)